MLYHSIFFSFSKDITYFLLLFHFKAFFRIIFLENCLFFCFWEFDASSPPVRAVLLLAAAELLPVAPVAEDVALERVALAALDAGVKHQAAVLNKNR